MTIETIAGKAGLTPRAVRYYVQTGIIDAPFGKGRGARYGAIHLRQIEDAKAMKDAGYTLEHIAAARCSTQLRMRCASISAPAEIIMQPADGVRVSMSADVLHAAGLSDTDKLDAELRKLFEKFGF